MIIFFLQKRGLVLAFSTNSGNQCHIIDSLQILPNLLTLNKWKESKQFQKQNWFLYISPTKSHTVSTIFLGAFFGVFWKQITPNNRQGTSQLDSSRRSKISLYFLPDLCLSWRLWFLGYHNLWPNWRNNWELCQVDGLLVRTGDLILVRSSHIHREVKWKDNSGRNENNDNHSCKQTKGDKKHQRRTSTLKHFKNSTYLNSTSHGSKHVGWMKQRSQSDWVEINRFNEMR